MNYKTQVRDLISQRFEGVPLADVVTFGCAQNENDSEKIRGLLYEVGYSMTDSLENADIVIYNTCAIRENAELKIFGNIGKLKALKKANPNMIVAVCGCMVMQEHIVEKIKKSDEEIKLQCHMLEALNSVIKLLEPDDSFVSTAEKALESTVKALGLSGAFIIRQNVDGASFEVIVSSGDNRLKTISTSEVPFFTGRQYIISSNSVRPEKFRNFMGKYAINAAVFQPMYINNNCQMYVCFYDRNENRMWEKSDISFLNDTKCVIQSVLSKKITTNSLAGSYASLEAILENTGCGIYVADILKQEILYMNSWCKVLLENTIEQNGLENHVLLDAANTKSFEEIYSVEEDKWFDVHRTDIKWVDGRQVRLVTLYDIME